MWETNSYKAHEDYMMLYEALEKSMNRDHIDKLLTNLAEARRKKKKRHDSPKTPPGSLPHQPAPPPPPAGTSRTSGSFGASGSSQLPPHPPPLSTSQSRLSHRFLKDLHTDDDTALDEQVHSSDEEDIENAHIPKTSDIAIFMNWFCKKQGITKLKPQDLEGLAFDIVKVFHPNVMEECHKLLTDRVDKSIIRPALSISEMKAAYYPNVGLEQMVPDQMWIEKECKHTSEGDRRAVRTHMRILSVVRIEVFSMHGYDYIK
nr:hypothetical protein [Tanacetum cinerariifolium]